MNPFEALPLTRHLEQTYDVPAQHTADDFAKAVDHLSRQDSQDYWLFSRLAVYLDPEPLFALWQSYVNDQQVYYRPDVLAAAVAHWLDRQFSQIAQDLVGETDRRFSWFDERLDDALKSLAKKQL